MRNVRFNTFETVNIVALRFQSLFCSKTIQSLWGVCLDVRVSQRHLDIWSLGFFRHPRKTQSWLADWKEIQPLFRKKEGAEFASHAHLSFGATSQSEGKSPNSGAWGKEIQYFLKKKQNKTQNPQFFAVCIVPAGQILRTPWIECSSAKIDKNWSIHRANEMRVSTKPSKPNEFSHAKVRPEGSIAWFSVRYKKTTLFVRAFHRFGKLLYSGRSRIP